METKDSTIKRNIINILKFIGVVIFLLLCSSIPMVILLLAKGDVTTVDLVMAQIIGYAIFFIVVKSKYKDIMNELSLKKSNNIYKDLLKYVIPFYAVSVGLSLVVHKIIPYNPELETHTEIILNLPMWTKILLSVIVAPLFEEFVFRGISYKLLKYNIPVYMIVSSIAFGAMHYASTGDLMTNINMMATTGIMGAVLGYAYHKTQDIRVPIAVHFLNNAVALIVGSLT